MTRKCTTEKILDEKSYLTISRIVVIVYIEPSQKEPDKSAQNITKYVRFQAELAFSSISKFKEKKIAYSWVVLNLFEM